MALFRYGLIADLAQLPPGIKGLYALIARRLNAITRSPARTRTRVAPETLRDWLKHYRRGGFDALLPKPRADRGRPRALPAAVADALLGIKEGNPKLSVQLVIREAREHPEVPPELPLPPATVHRLLARHGLMDKSIDEPSEADRRRFAFQRAGEMWMSDVMHGPTVWVGGRKRKTYLIAFIDDATRVIPHCGFALAENTTTFLPVLKQALLRRGLPARLYVDNGSNYRSRHLSLVCAKLGIALIHSRPYQPQGRGKIERWFKTVRAQLLTRLTAADVASLEALNRRLNQWAEGEYHHVTPPRPGRPYPAGTVGPVGRRGSLTRAGGGPGRPVPVRDPAQGAERPHRQPPRGGVRGRCRAGRGEGHPALRPIRPNRACHPGVA